LLNYAVKGWGGAGLQDEFGFSLSAGPTVALGQSGGASTFGFFGGPTFRVWDRLFLSVGAHIGQFSDFPPGLQNYSTIPDDYGALTPVKRWTTRLAFGITYRTNDFSAVKKKSDTTTATTK